jgi:hypothetical protein
MVSGTEIISAPDTNGTGCDGTAGGAKGDIGLPHDEYDCKGAGKVVYGKRSIVFWCSNPEKQLRAVYGDFTVATIADADLPKKLLLASSTEPNRFKHPGRRGIASA